MVPVPVWQEELKEAGSRLRTGARDLEAAREELEQLHAHYGKATEQLQHTSRELDIVQEQAQHIPGLTGRIEELETELKERETALHDLQVRLCGIVRQF